mmetsp:Transcript_1834/g.8194  ORF Transcript_1834/g.8194 Transcript_1834/m.8194 type:complete len:204 (-) Transcript_1834:86-697(-)
MLPSASRSICMDCARRAAFCAAVCCASSLARLVSRPAFQRAERRPPPASSSSDPRNVGADAERLGRLPPTSGVPSAATLGLFSRAWGLRGLGRAFALRFCLACRLLSRTPHALQSVLGPSGPLRHSGVVCVLQCAQRLPGIPGRSPSCDGTSITEAMAGDADTGPLGTEVAVRETFRNSQTTPTARTRDRAKTRALTAASVLP